MVKIFTYACGQAAHRPQSLHIGKQILVIFSMVSIGGWNKSWAPILAGGKADQHCEMTGNTTNVVS